LVDQAATTAASVPSGRGFVAWRSDIALFIDLHARVQHLAAELHLRARPVTVANTISAQFAMKRLISVKLEPDRHPIRSDSPVALCLHGLRISLVHPFWSAEERILNAVWFVAALLAPHRLAHWLLRRRLYAETLQPLTNGLARWAQLKAHLRRPAPHNDPGSRRTVAGSRWRI
jgi:hypothetical protein